MNKQDKAVVNTPTQTSETMEAKLVRLSELTDQVFEELSQSSQDYSPTPDNT